MKQSMLDNIFIPRKTHKKDTKDFLIEISSEIKINSRFFLKDPKFPNIIFFHGNAEIANDYDDISILYNNSGFNFVVIEYRGYGLSSGIPTSKSFHNDSIHTFDSVCIQLNKLSYIGNTIVMGRSLGSVAACFIAAKRSSLIKACIIESGFATEDFFFNLVNIKKSQFETFGNLESIKKYNKPLLVIHSLDDHIVPFNQAELLYDSACSNNKYLYKIENANHNNIIVVEKEKYFNTIKAFYDSII